MLSLRDTNILGYDTPLSVRLSVADIIGEYKGGTIVPYILTSLIEIVHIVISKINNVHWHLSLTAGRSKHADLCFLRPQKLN